MDSGHTQSFSAIPQAGAQPEVILKGDLDIYGATALRDALDGFDQPGVLDMRAVRYIDSAGLTELVRIAKRVGLGKVTLIIATPMVRKVLRICGFQHLFRIVDAVPISANTVP